MLATEPTSFAGLPTGQREAQAVRRDVLQMQFPGTLAAGARLLSR